MLYLDFHPMSNFSRKDFLYNKALATTLDGSRKFLAQSLAKSSYDVLGSTTKFDDILEKYRSWVSGWKMLGTNSHGLILWENDATWLRIIFIRFIRPPEA